MLNTHVTRWDEREAAAVRDVVFALLGEEGWKVQLVGRDEDVLHREGAQWRFHRRRASFVTDG